MNWKDRTWDLAWQAAEQYYDNVLKKGKYPGEFNLYRKVDRDDAIYDLAKRYVGKLRKAIPEETYNEDMAKRVDALDIGAVEKYMFEFGEEPFGATRKGDFDKVMDKWCTNLVMTLPEKETVRSSWRNWQNTRRHMTVRKW